MRSEGDLYIYIFSYYPYEEKSEEVTVEGKINHNWATSNVMEKNESTYMHLHKEFEEVKPQYFGIILFNFS